MATQAWNRGGRAFAADIGGDIACSLSVSSVFCARVARVRLRRPLLAVVYADAGEVDLTAPAKMGIVCVRDG